MVRLKCILLLYRHVSLLEYTNLPTFYKSKKGTSYKTWVTYSMRPDKIDWFNSSIKWPQSRYCRYLFEQRERFLMKKHIIYSRIKPILAKIDNKYLFFFNMYAPWHFILSRIDDWETLTSMTHLKLTCSWIRMQGYVFMYFPPLKNFKIFPIFAAFFVVIRAL